MNRDVFISHASEDKDAIARPLALELIDRGLTVWFDEYELALGDSLRRKIDAGLRDSRIGVVILSPHFFTKEWPQIELDGLHTRREAGEEGVIVPIWHGLEVADVRRASPMLAGLVAAKSSVGVEKLADEIERSLRQTSSGPVETRATVPASPKKRRRPAVRPSDKAAPRRPVSVILGGFGRITDLPADLSEAERAEMLAERVVAAITGHTGQGLMIIGTASRNAVELSRRGDGVITIRSDLLSPRKRVLEAGANALLKELTKQALLELLPGQLKTVEVRTTPSSLARMHSGRMHSGNAAEDQKRLADSLLLALRGNDGPREILLRESRGTLLMDRAEGTVKLTVSPSSGEKKEVSLPLDHEGLEKRLLEGLGDVSTPRTFGRGAQLEDRFPLREAPHYSRLRVLTEQLIASDGEFGLWQQAPGRGRVLKVSRRDDEMLVLSRPGSTRSAISFKISEMVRFVEAFEAEVKDLVKRSPQPLEAWANFLTWELDVVVRHTALPTPSSRARRRQLTS